MLEKYEKWLYDFMESWRRLEGVPTTRLISEKACYYENPVDEPCKDFEKIKSLWEIVPTNQKDITYSYEIMSYSDEYALVNFKMERIFIPNNEKQIIDGIFQISLDENGLCTYFKQWRFTKSESLA